jgi:hypothetical protein
VGLWYVVGDGRSSKVVQLVSVDDRQGMLQATEYEVCDMKFRKKWKDASVQVPVHSVTFGPFNIVAGRTCASAAARVTELIGEGPAPSSSRKRPVSEVEQPAIMRSSRRFRFLRALMQLQSMGFEDSRDMRDILELHEGCLPSTLRFIRSLEKVKDMGFEDTPQMRGALARHGGDVGSAVRECLSR